MEALFRETTGNLVPLAQLQPGVMTVEEKLDKKPQDEGSCIQATSVRGPIRPAALGSADSGIKI